MEDKKGELIAYSDTVKINAKAEKPKGKKGGKIAAAAMAAIMGGAAVLGAAKALEKEDKGKFLNFDNLDVDFNFEPKLPNDIEFENTIPELDLETNATQQQVYEKMNDSKYRELYRKYLDLNITHSMFSESEKQKYDITDDKIYLYNSIIEKHKSTNMYAAFTEALIEFEKNDDMDFLNATFSKMEQLLDFGADYLVDYIDATIYNVMSGLDDKLNYDTLVTYYNCLSDEQKQLVLNNDKHPFDNESDLKNYIKLGQEKINFYNSVPHIPSSYLDIIFKLHICDAESMEDLIKLDSVKEYLKKTIIGTTFLMQEDLYLGSHVNKSLLHAGDIYNAFKLLEDEKLNKDNPDFVKEARAVLNHHLSDKPLILEILKYGEDVCNKLQETYNVWDDVEELKENKFFANFTFIDDNKVLYLADYIKKCALGIDDFAKVSIGSDLAVIVENANPTFAYQELTFFSNEINNFQKDVGKFFNDMVNDNKFDNNISLYKGFMSLFWSLSDEDVAQHAAEANMLPHEYRDVLKKSLLEHYQQLEGDKQVTLPLMTVSSSDINQIPKQTFATPNFVCANQINDKSYVFKLDNCNNIVKLNLLINGDKTQLDNTNNQLQNGILVNFEGEGLYALAANAVYNQNGLEIESEYSPTHKFEIMSEEKTYFEALNLNMEEFLAKYNRTPIANEVVLDANYKNDVFNIQTSQEKDGIEILKKYNVNLGKTSILPKAENIFDLALASSALISAINNSTQSIVSTNNIDSNSLYNQTKQKFAKPMNVKAKAQVKTFAN